MNEDIVPARVMVSGASLAFPMELPGCCDV